MKRISFEEALELPQANAVLEKYKLLDENGDPNQEAINKQTKEEKELLAFGIQYYGKHCKVDVWQLGGADSTNKMIFDKNIKVKLVKKDGLYEVEYYVQMQMQYKRSGRYHELLEKKTEAWWPEHEQNNKEREERQQREVDAKDTLESALSSIRKPRATKAKPTIAAPPVMLQWGVSDNYEQFEDPTDKDGLEYIFKGTETECEEYVLKNCPAEGTYSAFVIEMRTRKPTIKEGSQKFEAEKKRRIAANTLKI